MTRLDRRLLLAGLAAAAPAVAGAQENFPALVANAVELSGGGAIAGTSFNNGVLLGLKEINGAGGVLGRRLEPVTLDIQTNPEVAKAAVRKATAMGAVAIMGPVFSDMVTAAADEIRAAGIPSFIGGEAAGLTLQGNPYLFRTSLSQAASMPRLARYLRQGIAVESVAMVWVDNEFGRGGREAMAKALAAEGIRLVADLPTRPGQTDFSDVAARVRESDAGAVFVYLNEAESPACLQALHDAPYSKWVVGETTLVGQAVLDRAGEAASGARGHVGLTPDALVPGVPEFANAFLREYGYRGDHNGMKGYIAAHVLKAAAERAGRLEPRAVAEAMRGLAVSAADHPGVLLDVRYDDKGDLDRASFVVRVINGRQQFIAMLPASAGNF
jgi:branched-chain amino acid transport system substrate-binding protein